MQLDLPQFMASIETLTPDEKRLKILEALQEISVDMTDIKAQIQEAKITAAVQHEYADPDWWHRANMALRIKGTQHQRLQNELTKIKLAHSIESDRNNRADRPLFEQCFVKVARMVLSKDQYMKIAETAGEMTKTISESNIAGV